MKPNRVYPMFVDLAKWGAEVIKAHNDSHVENESIEMAASQMITFTARLIKALDPVAFPWSRAQARWRVERMHRSLLRDVWVPASQPWERKHRPKKKIVLKL